MTELTVTVHRRWSLLQGRFRLYTIRGHRPWWWWRGRRLYIGCTGRRPVARWVEHLDRKPWADEIGSISASWRRWRTVEACEAAERRAIHRHEPPKNTAHVGCRCARRRLHR